MTRHCAHCAYEMIGDSEGCKMLHVQDSVFWQVRTRESCSALPLCLVLEGSWDLHTLKFQRLTHLGVF